MPTRDGASRRAGGSAAPDGLGRRQGIHSPEDRRFVGLAAAALDDYVARNSIAASIADDTRFDARLPDYSRDGVAEQVRVLNRHVLALDSIDPVALSRGNAVDLRILRSQLTLRAMRLRVLEEPAWNPMWWSPAMALEPLFARAAPPVPAIVARLRAMPEFLESARTSLGVMALPHVELSIAELSSAPSWLRSASRALAAQTPAAADELHGAAEAALVAMEEHRRWLVSRLASATHDPRLGARRYGELFGLLMGPEHSVEQVRRQAESSLAELGEELRSLSGRVLGRSLASRRLVQSALAAVSTRYLLSSDGLVDAATRSVEAARTFVVDRRLVTVPAFNVQVVRMPAVRSGRAAAFSELRSGRRADLRIAVMGPDPGWAETRRASFMREYNALMLDAVMCHQAVPGHALQMSRAESALTPTRVRSVFPDQVFAEGWAYYAQRLLSQHGYGGSVAEPDPAGFALQELKLRMRGVANALLDIGFHTGGLDEPQARRLMGTAAMAEEGEFVMKWRRVQTSAGVLSTYFVGNQAVSELVGQVRGAGPRLSDRQVHDRVLMHGAVPPAGVRELLGLGPDALR